MTETRMSYFLVSFDVHCPDWDKALTNLIAPELEHHDAFVTLPRTIDALVWISLNPDVVIIRQDEVQDQSGSGFAHEQYRHKRSYIRVSQWKLLCIIVPGVSTRTVKVPQAKTFWHFRDVASQKLY